MATSRCFALILCRGCGAASRDAPFALLCLLTGSHDDKGCSTDASAFLPAVVATPADLVVRDDFACPTVTKYSLVDRRGHRSASRLLWRRRSANSRTEPLRQPIVNVQFGLVNISGLCPGKNDAHDGRLPGGDRRWAHAEPPAAAPFDAVLPAISS